MSCLNVIQTGSMDDHVRSLKVATRVRIPLGLQRKTSSEGMWNSQQVHTVHQVVLRAVWSMDKAPSESAVHSVVFLRRVVTEKGWRLAGAVKSQRVV